MSKLLYIKSSILGEAGMSTQLAQTYIDQWQLANAEGEVVVRDLVAENLPHLDADVMAALRAPADEHTDVQRDIAACSDAFIQELRDADVILIGVPMYNFSIPTQLKTYFDWIAKAGVTFKYTETGPVGLLEDKPVYLLATRGGLYRDSGQDFQIPFVKQFLSFIGFNQVETIYAEGLSMEGIAETSLAAANNAIAALH